MILEPHFLDSLTENTKPLPASSKKKPIRLFVCGLTVYDVPHIGNARTYLVFDIFVRYLRAIGVSVFYLQNITDVDDKIIARAERDKRKASEVARDFQKIYLKNMKQLGITTVDKYAPATKFIPQIVTQVERLIKKGNVYMAEDGYYFDLTTFPDYGKLAHRTLAQAEDGVSRIDESVSKKNRGDFCVWKFSKPGEPTWKTKIGAGRPGWHIEDTAISEHFFGPQYDIHGGGVDLKFPHHEAEIAQQESVSEKKPFVNIWMHVGALTVNGRKMSKSLNNFVTINDFLTQYDPQILRLITLSSHYRSPLHYTDETPQVYTQSWKNILGFLAKMAFVEEFSKASSQGKMQEAKQKTQALSEQFFNALADDFNTPQAMAAIFEFMNTVQPNAWKLSVGEARHYRETVKKLLEVLGFTITPSKIPSKITTLLKKRELARNNQQFMQSDDLRKRINELGYSLDDTPFGQFVRPS